MRWFALITMCVLGLAGGGSAVTAATKAPVPLEAYGALPAIDHVAISLSGKRFAFVSEEPGNRRLFVRDIGGDAIMAPKLGEVKVRGVRFAGDDFVLVSATSTITNHELHHYHPRHYELLSVLIINLNARSVSYVFQDLEGFEQLVTADYGARVVDGRWVGFFSSSDDGLYRVDLATAKTRRVAEETSRQADWLLDAEGRVAARVEASQSLHFWSLVNARGTRILHSEVVDPEDRPVLLGFGRTADTALVRERTADGDLVEEVSLNGGKPTVLLSGAEDDDLLFDPKSRLFLGAVGDIDSRVTVYDPRLSARLAGVMKAFPGQRVRPVSFTPGFDTVVALTDGGADTGTYWVIDLATGKATELSDRYPTIPADQIGAVSLYRYSASDGLPIEAVLTLPPGRAASALPLVVMPHGGPVGVHDTVAFDWWAQAFASRGYAVLQPNFRGSDGYGLAFEHASRGEWGRKMQTDLSDGVAALARSGLIDPKRVCIVGASYGGYAALAGVTLQSGVYRCAVSVAGISDVGELLSHKNTDKTDAGRYLKGQLGAAWAGAEALAKISPLYNAERAGSPVLLIHGTDDTVVDPRQSDWMKRELEKNGKPVRFVPLDGDDHWLSRAATRTRMVVESVSFVEANNPP